MQDSEQFRQKTEGLAGVVCGVTKDSASVEVLDRGSIEDAKEIY